MICVWLVVPFHILKMVLKLLLDMVNLLDPVGSCWVQGGCCQVQVEARVEPVICKELTVPMEVCSACCRRTKLKEGGRTSYLDGS